MKPKRGGKNVHKEVKQQVRGCYLLPLHFGLLLNACFRGKKLGNALQPVEEVRNLMGNRNKEQVTVEGTTSQVPCPCLPLKKCTRRGRHE
jgi:hypothetical protein